MLRTDQTPVLVFETETDTVGHFAARQPDSTTYRLWEGTGTAHADSYDVAYFGLNTATQEPFYPATQPCAFPSNTANERHLMDAAMLRLSQWISGGTPPPSGQPINVIGGFIQRDSLGIALDGIRLPEMDVPTLTQQGTGNSGPGFCILFGREIPLPVSLSSLYSNHGKYVRSSRMLPTLSRAAGSCLNPMPRLDSPQRRSRRCHSINSSWMTGVKSHCGRRSFREPERSSRTDPRVRRKAPQHNFPCMFWQEF